MKILPLLLLLPFEAQDAPDVPHQQLILEELEELAPKLYPQRRAELNRWLFEQWSERGEVERATPHYESYLEWTRESDEPMHAASELADIAGELLAAGEIEEGEEAFRRAWATVRTDLDSFAMGSIRIVLRSRHWHDRELALSVLDALADHEGETYEEITARPMHHEHWKHIRALARDFARHGELERALRNYAVAERLILEMEGPPPPKEASGSFRAKPLKHQHYDQWKIGEVELHALAGKFDEAHELAQALRYDVGAKSLAAIAALEMTAGRKDAARATLTAAIDEAWTQLRDFYEQAGDDEELLAQKYFFTATTERGLDACFDVLIEWEDLEGAESLVSEILEDEAFAQKWVTPLCTTLAIARHHRGDSEEAKAHLDAAWAVAEKGSIHRNELVSDVDELARALGLMDGLFGRITSEGASWRLAEQVIFEAENGYPEVARKHLKFIREYRYDKKFTSHGRRSAFHVQTAHAYIALQDAEGAYACLVDALEETREWNEEEPYDLVALQRVLETCSLMAMIGQVEAAREAYEEYQATWDPEEWSYFLEYMEEDVEVETLVPYALTRICLYDDPGAVTLLKGLSEKVESTEAWKLLGRTRMLTGNVEGSRAAYVEALGTSDGRFWFTKVLRHQVASGDAVGAFESARAMRPRDYKHTLQTLWWEFEELPDGILERLAE